MSLLSNKMQRIDWKLQLLGWGLLGLSAWLTWRMQLDAAALAFANGIALLAQAKWDRKAGLSLPRRDPRRTPEDDGGDG